MAFKKVRKESSNYDTIESLFWDLSTSNDIQSLYAHQTDILRHYEEKASKAKNVTIELPTGSGKTLVGLLIAEYKRRLSNSRVLYLCPTKQLVNQVVQMANLKYGIKAIGFTGKKTNYTPEAKIAYNNSDAVAVTTYNSLFNINPWFDSPDLIVIDDAHSAENYIPSTWSLQITRGNKFQIYRAILDVFKSTLSYNTYKTLINNEGENVDRIRVEKISNIALFDKKEELYDILATYTKDDQDLKWGWLQLSNHLEACQIFINWREILIRPLIPPSFTNAPFNNAGQKIFMSATLGEGGDLERITGVKSFHKIPIPTGWDKRGMGRRLFMFPGLSLENPELGELTSELLIRNNRTVVLVSSDNQVENFRLQLEKLHPEVNFFSAKDIEISKAGFISSDKAAVVLANRFDGIDFAEDQSRLLMLIGIPYASNLQEKFFQSRMNAEIIFNDRNRTRLVQAIGRCTRSPKDYSVIYVYGEKDLSEWLVLNKKSKFLHPELQAELQFGITNSRNTTKEEFLENYDIFMKQEDTWNEVNQGIIEDRSNYEKSNLDGTEQLEKSAKLEVVFQEQIWNKLYKEAFDTVNLILESLQGGSNLKGYRAYWNYQAGCVSYYLYVLSQDEIYLDKRNQFFEKLVQICPSATWSRSISDVVINDLKFDEYLVNNIERLQIYLNDINILKTNKYNLYLKKVTDFIDNKDLENLNLHIGLLLGYEAINPESQGSPDPYWISNDKFAIVFEDKIYKSEDDFIPLGDIRQALSHEAWMRANVESITEATKIYTVIVSNRDKIDKVSNDLCGELLYWAYDDFVIFSQNVLSIARKYSKYYSGENDSNWKDFFVDDLHKQKMGPRQIINSLVKLSSRYEV